MKRLNHLKDTDNCHWKDYPTKGKTLRNIARYDRGRTSFSGYRLAMAANGFTFLRYFSDSTFGSAQRALQATMWARDIIRQRLNEIKIHYADRSIDTRKRIASMFLEEVSTFPTELFYLALTLDIDVYDSEE